MKMVIYDSRFLAGKGVFATAHEKYMGDAFEVYAFDYLLKPFREQRVMKTLALIRSRLAEEAESGAADVRSVKELAAVLRELTALGRALEQEEEKDETVRVVLTEEVEPWSE